MRRTKVLPLALLALLLAAALISAGCGSDGGAAAGDASAASADSTPTNGGVAKFATTFDLDPPTFFTGNNAQAFVAGLVYNRLMEYPADSLEPQPSLAKSWKLSKDGKSLTLQLRNDVTFHSGRKFTSKDVQFSIKQYADPKRAAQFARTAAAVVGFDTSKPDEITLELAHPTSNIFDLLTIVPILDRETMDEFESGKEFDGTGPFEFVSWSPGSKIVLKADKNYWGGAPHLEGAELDIVPSPQTQVSELRAGQVDGIYDASFVDLQSLEKSGQYQLLKLTGTDRALYVGVNLENTALQDPRLRQAIAYAIDRERIAADVFRGFGTPINLPWPSYSPAYSASGDKTYTHDTEKAKQLVTEIGNVAAVPVSYISESPNSSASALIIQSNLEEVGIPVKLEPTDSTQATKLTIGGEFPGLWVSEHSFGQFSPSTLAVTAYPFNAELNASHFSSKAYEDAANAAWESPEAESPSALKAYEQINEILLKELFVIELVDFDPVVAATPDLHGVTWTKRNELNLSKAYLSN
jgi:peptide/nickel transport system substrate-binding protein